MEELSEFPTEKIVLEVLSRLSAKEKTVIQYKFALGLTYFQIAGLTGLRLEQVGQIIRATQLKIEKQKKAILRQRMKETVLKKIASSR